MLRGLWRLTWLEIKIFAREPLGLIGSVAIPVLLFVFVGRALGPRGLASPRLPRFIAADLPIFASLLIVLSAVVSLVVIVAIYRESGILKRLRATPLRSGVILTAHVIVKLLFTALTLAIMILAGRRSYPIDAGVPLVSYAIALLFVTASVSSLGFVIASLVPASRFAQPISTLIVYPLLGLSGLFVPIAVLPPTLQTVARATPLTYAVSLLRGIWHGDGWPAHTGDVAVLAAMAAACLAISAAVFRWE